jgi:predicted metal-binding membrane protein
MNLLWVAAMAVLVLVEKVAPGGDLIGRIAGAALLVAGIALIVRCHRSRPCALTVR